MQTLPDGHIYAPCCKCGELVFVPPDMTIRVRCLREKDYTEMLVGEASQIVNVGRTCAWRFYCLRCAI